MGVYYFTLSNLYMYVNAQFDDQSFCKSMHTKRISSSIIKQIIINIVYLFLVSVLNKNYFINDKIFG